MTTADSITAVMRLPSSDELASAAQQATMMVEGVHIGSDAELQLVTDDLRAMKAHYDALEERRLQITRPMDQAKASVMDLFRGPLTAIQSAITAGKAECLRYIKARDERIAAERREAERLAAAERARLQAEADAIAITSPEQALAVADKLTQAAMTVAPIMPAPARMAGAHTRQTWDADVTDWDRAVVALLAAPAFRACVTIDRAALRKLAQVTRGTVKIDGVRFYEKEGMALR